MFLIKSLEAFELGAIGTEHAGFSHCCKQPEGLSLVASIYEHNETHHKVHALAVAYLVIVN